MRDTERDTELLIISMKSSDLEISWGIRAIFNIVLLQLGLPNTMISQFEVFALVEKLESIRIVNELGTPEWQHRLEHLRDLVQHLSKTCGISN